MSLPSTHFDTRDRIGVIRRFIAEPAGLGADQFVAMQDFVFHLTPGGVLLADDAVHEGL